MARKAAAPGPLEAKVREYVAALESGDLQRMLGLFAPEARVTSPLAGTRDADAFYKLLFESSGASRVRLLESVEDTRSAAAHLEYDWTLTNGKRTRFECMDLFHFDDEGRIRELKIFYDPAEIRSDYLAVNSTRETRKEPKSPAPSKTPRGPEAR